MQNSSDTKRIATLVAAPKQEPAGTDVAVTLTYDDMKIVGLMLAKNLHNRGDLMSAIAATTSFTVEGVPVFLDPRLLIRLKSRCLDKNNWEKWLSEVVNKQLHDYAGY